MNDLNDFISKINTLEDKILAIKSIPEKDSIILLKTDLLKSKLFIEILDLNNAKSKHIVLNPMISNIISFHPIDLENFYINGSYNGDSDYHLKIGVDGNVLYHKKFDTEIRSINHKIVLKDFIFREDLKLLDFKDFEEYDLEEFMINHFQDKYDFTYLYFSESRYKTFSLPNNNILGLEIYNKDGDAPRMYFIILRFHSPTNINIQFDGKIDDCSNSYLLSQNAQEIVYRSTWYLSDGSLKSRKLSPKEFKYFENLNLSRERNTNNNFEEEVIYFDEKIIMILYSNDFEKYNTIEVYDRKDLEFVKNKIFIDKRRTHQMMNGKLFFIRDSKLNYIEILK